MCVLIGHCAKVINHVPKKEGLEKRLATMLMEEMIRKRSTYVAALCIYYSLCATRTPCMTK